MDPFDSRVFLLPRQVKLSPLFSCRAILVRKYSYHLLYYQVFKYDKLVLEKLVREVLGMSDMAVKGGGRSEYEEERKAWDGKQKKEYVKEKIAYNKAESKEDKSGDVFGRKIGLEEMVRVYQDMYKKVVGRLGVAKVKEMCEEWDVRKNREKVEAKRKRQEVEKSQVRGEEEQEPPVKRKPSSGPLENFRPGPAPGTQRSWCSECDRHLTGGPSHLQVHKDTVHLGLRPWECAGCDSKFGRKSNLEEHISHTHLGQKFSSCNVEGCGRSFQNNTLLKDHGRAEHNHPLLCCPDCGATYAWTSDFNIHRRKHRDFFWA